MPAGHYDTMVLLEENYWYVKHMKLTKLHKLNCTET